MHKQRWLDAAKAAGIEQLEIYEQKSRSTSIRLFEGSVDGYTISECNGFAIRGIYKGNMGICFLEQDDDALLEDTLCRIKENAEVITSRDEVEIYAGDSAYPQLQLRSCTWNAHPDAEKIEMLKTVEQYIKESDARIAQVMNTSYGEVDVEIAIDNTLGVHLHDAQHAAYISTAVMAKDQEDTKIAGDWQYLYDDVCFDAKKFAAGVSRKVLDKLSAESVQSAQYPVLIENEAMADLLAAFSGMFDGENAYKGISLLNDSIEKQIFSDKITIVDDPLLKNGYNSRSFDDEGVACRNKILVDKGVLKTYLHNLKSAKLMNCETTGNGFKAGYASNVGIAPSTLFIENGSTSMDEMIASMEEGIIVTEITGLHAGLNAMTGEFSLQSQGWYVKDGKKVKPVNLITIAGNFLEAMKQVEMLGNDGKLNAGSIGSPSILFTSFSVSGL